MQKTTNDKPKLIVIANESTTPELDNDIGIKLANT